MAASDGIPAQLAALLGHPVKRIRKTDETPPRVSVIDVISAITGKDARHSAEQLRRLLDLYPDVDSNCVHVKFLDARGRRGQRGTPALCVRGIVELIMLLQGRQAAQVRRQAAELLCRYLGGDLALVDEVCQIHGFQQQLAAVCPNDPRRVFGDMVEASSSASTPLARVLSTISLLCTAARAPTATEASNTPSTVQKAKKPTATPLLQHATKHVEEYHQEGCT